MSEPPSKRAKLVDSPQMSQNGSAHDLKFDNAYSRLIHAIGKDALLRLQSAKVLISGLNGLGAEVAKNIVLMGVASLTIRDPNPVQISDLSSQFFFSEADVGKNRAETSLPKLTEMNERVELSVHNEELSETFLKSFTIVCLTDVRSRDELVRINNFCHQNNIAFIAGGVPGLFGYIFVDFGEAFTINDHDGEQPKSSYVELITKDEQGIVTVVESQRHDLEDGDTVRITEVQGMTELNGKEFTINVKGPFQFSIGDTRAFGDYKKGGFIEQVKKPRVMSFKPYASFLNKPVEFADVLMSDYSKFDRPAQYHYYLQALLLFIQQNNRLPRPHSNADAATVVGLAKEVHSQIPPSDEVAPVNDALITTLAKTAAGDLSPMCAFLGGIIAQEIIKATSAKYTPIHQFFYFDSLESLTSDNIPEEEAAPMNSRYDGQIAVFGRTFNQRILDLKYFLVGAGAIGCEMLKNWAMMGIGCGANGHVDVTDMDTIEISNLNRQFLYRPWDIGQMKSFTAAKAVKNMNPHMNIKAWNVKVAPETESTYDETFWKNLSGVCNALDNVPARLYVDGRCVYYKKSLLESGTLSTKGNVQVVVPHLTESYGSSRDPPPKEAPVCLLHSFPNNIEHCLQWAREDAFEGHFVKDADIVNNYLTKPGYIDTLNPTLKLSALETLDRCMLKREQTFDECILFGRRDFEKRYNHAPKQLLHNFPLDYVDSNGTPFWSGAKRPPTPIVFNADDDMHLDFIVASAFLRAYTLGIIESEFKPEDLAAKREYIREKVRAITVPAFVPKSGLKINTDEKATTAVEHHASDDDDRRANEITAALPKPETVSWRMRPLSFEKDDDANFHIDYVAAASNLRATAYGIPTADRLKSKLIAGKIVPAIVTTTAAVTGLVCLELYKLFQTPAKKIEDFRNTFINLALPLFQSAEPQPPAKRKYAGKEFTLWDRIEVRLGDATLQQVIDYFQNEHQIEVDMLGVGTALIYAGWMGAKAKERLPRKLTEIVQEITKQQLPPNQKHLMLEITASDADGNDIEDLPDVAFYFA